MEWTLGALVVVAIWWIVQCAKALPFWKIARDNSDLFLQHCELTPGWYVYPTDQKPQQSQDLIGPFMHMASDGTKYRIYADADRIEQLQSAFVETLNESQSNQH